MNKIKSNIKILYFIIFELMLCLSFSGIFYLYHLNKIALLLLMLLTLINYFYHFYHDLFKKMLEWLVKYRFAVFLFIFIFLVIFKIHGSSMGIYDYYFKEKIEPNKTSILLGGYRGVRSDEWAVMTPYYFSQHYNDYNKISHQMSLDGQNMIIGYNSPVKDISVLAKPLVWGFILLGNEYGLSWYWCLKMIFIILFSFELFYILTKKNIKMSILGSILVSLGPSLQWWFAPHMPDVILWAMVLFSLAYHFFTHNKNLIRNLCTILLPFVVLEYVVALFPSFQVGLGYLIVVLFVCLIFRDNIKLFENKKQFIRNSIVIISSLCLIGYFVYSNIDALHATMNTVYPGSRIDTGGNFIFKDLFTDLATPFLSYFNSSPYLNQSEDSTFIHFGIFILMLSPLLISKLKQKGDKDWIVGLGLTILIVVDIVFMLIGFPTLLAKLTFFSYINRMKMILGFIFIIYTIWGLKYLIKFKNEINKWYYLGCVLVYCGLLLTFIDDNLKEYLPFYIYYAEILIFGIILMLLKTKKENIAYGSIICLILFSGLIINPTVTGISSLKNHPSVTAISQIINEDKDSYWIAYDNVFYSSYLLANGVKTFNAVNFYPDYAKWKVIDPDGVLDPLYNRYAHIKIIYSTDGINRVKAGESLDSVHMELTLGMMRYYNVKYIFTKKDLSSIIEENYQLQELYADSDVKIYEIVERTM